MRVWYIVFFALFFWELLPEYVFPLLVGFSIFCLAKQDSLVFTNLFGGASGNEGLGMLSLGLDWNYIAAFFSPLWYPLQTTVNMNIGIFGCYILFMCKMQTKYIQPQCSSTYLMNRGVLQQPVEGPGFPFSEPGTVQRFGIELLRLRYLQSVDHLERPI